MADIHGVAADVHGGNRVGAAAVIQHQGLAAHAGLAARSVGQHHNGGAEVGDAAIAGDALGGNVAGGVGAACTTLAPVSRSCPAPAKVMPVNSMRAPSPCSTLIGYRQPVWGAEGTGYPLDRAAFFPRGRAWCSGCTCFWTSFQSWSSARAHPRRRKSPRSLHAGWPHCTSGRSSPSIKCR